MSDFDHDSRLGVSLQGFDQVIAISQAAINMCLAYRFKHSKKDMSFDIQNKKAGYSLKAKMKPPTVELFASEERYYGASLFLNFKSGFFTWWDFSEGEPKQIKIAVDGWAIPVQVRFDPQQLAGVPDEVRAQIEKPESYTITQLIIDFTSTYVASSVWADSVVSGIDKADSKDPEIKAMVKVCLEAYLETLKEPGDHNIIGYALTKGGAPAPKVHASLQPTSTRLQTMYYRPNGQESQQPSKSGRNAFLIKEMTNDRGMPDHDLTWTGNWFDSSLNGTLVMSHGNFWNGYLLPALAPHNRSILSALNSILAWTLAPSAPRREKDPWNLDNSSDVPLDDNLQFIASSDGHGEFKWAGKKRLPMEKSGFMGPVTDCNTRTSVQAKATWSTDSGNIGITTTATAEYQRDVSTRYEIGEGQFQTRLESYKATVILDWMTNLELAAVNDKGELRVKLSQGQPVCKVEVANNARSFFWFIYSPEWETNQKLTDLAKDIVTERLQSVDLVSRLEESINGQRSGFVFPGGGVFDMKSPVFSKNGDLLLGLTYKLTIED